MKKIMFVDNNQVVGYSGGVEAVICNFANEFIDRGYDVSIVCMNKEAGQPFFHLNKKVKFINLAYEYGPNPFKNIRYFYAKMTKEIIRPLKRYSSYYMDEFNDPRQKYLFNEFTNRLVICFNDIMPDFVFPTNVYSTFFSLEARNISKCNSTKIISMTHNDPTNSIVNKRSGEILQQCDAVQVLFPIHAKAYSNIVKRLVSIPNVVPQYTEEELVNLRECKYKITTVGRIDGSLKRQHLLIEAFVLIKDKYPEWSISIYGNISNKRYKKKLDKIIRDNNLENRVIFEGECVNIPEKLKNTDIFVFPSSREGFGMAVAEAMSIGLPVIAYEECRTMTSLIRHNETGILVEKGIVSLAEAIEYLINDMELRCKLGLQAHYAMKEYSAEIVWDKWEKLISELGRG